jgi:hypothetical protein
MTLSGIEIDVSKLLTKDKLLELLREHGENDSALGVIREQYEQDFGNELIWRYPLSDGWNMGTFIIPIREGFLSVPYDTVDCNEYEILELDEAVLLDTDFIDILLDDLHTYTHGLIGFLRDILRALRG